jgi:hypothetical protein
VQKAGNAESDYEDALAALSGRFAVADGATESSFAKTWAASLVRRFVESPPSVRELQHWLAPLQEQWQREVNSKVLPWYALEKAKLGAFSTLLGLEIHRGRRWCAMAAGDSCLFHVRRGSLIVAFPLERADQFGTTPTLLSSNPAKNREMSNWVTECSGELDLEDVFFLATDALACWILREVERGVPPWDALISLNGQAAFSEIIADARRSGAMRNDDATLLAVRIDGVPKDRDSGVPRQS